MGYPHVSSGCGGSRRPQLPAFCRTRRPTITVSVSSLSSLRNLLLVVLLVQLSTLLLVIAGPVPPRPVISTSTDLAPDSGVTTASGIQPMPPHSDR